MMDMASDINGVDTNKVELDLEQLIGIVLKHTQVINDDEIEQ